MVDKLNDDRIQRDRALFIRGNRQQLMDLIGQANPNLIAGAIARALELQIATEELARERGVDIGDEALAEFSHKHREFLNEQLDRAVNAFICSIVSQEG